MNFPRTTPPMPGLIPGFAGGTFNMDGSVVTPVSPESPQLPVRVPGLFGSGSPERSYPQRLPQGEVGSPRAPDRISQLGGVPLGGSMRRPMDYDAMMSQLLPPEKQPGTLKKIAMILGPALMAASGNQAGANQMMAFMGNQRQEKENYRRDVMMKLADMKWRDYARQNEADLRAADPFTIGRDRVQYDPATGQSSVLYDGPEDFEQYAGELGLQPGTPEYFQAVEDYVLKSSGPSAHARDVGLDDHRTSNDLRMEGVRQGNRVGMENLRQRNRGSLEMARQSNRLTLRTTPQAPRTGSVRGPEGIHTVRTPEEAMRLPSGTRFKTPDGRVKVVP